LIFILFFIKINITFAQDKPVYSMKKTDCVVLEPKHSSENNSIYQNNDNLENQVSMYKNVISISEIDVDNQNNNNNNKLYLKMETITNSKEFNKSKAEDILKQKKTNKL